MSIDKDKREMEKDSEPEVKFEREQMKELYKCGDYVCYASYTLKELSFKKDLNPSWYIGYAYKLIHKKHEAIADAVIANPDVEVEVQMVQVRGLHENIIWCDRKNFFNKYNKDEIYKLKETKPTIQLNGVNSIDDLLFVTENDINISVPSIEEIRRTSCPTDNELEDMIQNDYFDDDFGDCEFLEDEEMETISIADNKNVIERKSFIVRVSAIYGISYDNGFAQLRMKHGNYINKLQMSKAEFIELKEEFKGKIK